MYAENQLFLKSEHRVYCKVGSISIPVEPDVKHIYRINIILF